eukprot:CAMPEP_0173448354 /NCGR_PEP_ID=MMETSP1357-20121228/40586_1 /TAXON_ID=77926 /ORGANISM="Hemiselmis rufescens, Strain PCC563" /LENGTH=40 /DNA_ID= /DNA_START= /DNA_END= /DNA_ORIENTATION=
MLPPLAGAVGAHHRPPPPPPGPLARELRWQAPPPVHPAAP